MTDLDARYGRNQKNSKRNVVLLASALLVAFFVWAFFVNFGTPPEKARYSGEATSLLGSTDTSIEANLNIVGAGVTGQISCTLKALDPAYAIVGFKQQTFDFNGETERAVKVSVNTTAKAASVVVEACSLK